MILRGNSAKIILKFLLENFEGHYPYFNLSGYYKEGDYYYCFDNSHELCWVEQTKKKKRAIKWCKGEIEAEEL